MEKNNPTNEQIQTKNIYHLAMEFYRQDEIDDKLQIGRYITFIDLKGFLRVGQIIECKKSDFYSDEFQHYSEFIVKCQTLYPKTKGDNHLVTKIAVLDYIIKEGSMPQTTKVRLHTGTDLEFPLRT